MDIDPFACQITIERWKSTFKGKVEKITGE